MGREVSYEDAVKLLGGDAAKIVKLVDTLTGVGLLALVGPLRDTLGWFDAKAELSKVTERLVTELAEKRSKLSRYERTERLQAAHAVLAMTAFFEAMSETRWPFRYKDLALTSQEQRSLAAVREHVAGWSAPVPGPAESHEEFRDRLTDFYERTLGPRVEAFVDGLAVWERLDSDGKARFGELMTKLAGAAAARFDSLLGKLAAAFPEVAFWAGMREQAAIHGRLREVTTGLAGLREVLDAIAGGNTPDDRRRSLALRYAAALRKPIAESGEVPTGLRVPLLGEAFLPQRFRTILVDGHTSLSRESTWEPRPVRDDLLAFLTGYLTSEPAATAPLLILGQPGSGKSVLAKVLAGELPPTDFLPVLVPLRSVHAAADLQDQMEQAIRADTGERIDWPALSRSSGDALPVVILDGFDELLQATGVSQTDYLGRVAAFQRREAELGRPVAVIVTSRTSVADRSATPGGSVAIRLEPFDEVRVAAWLGVWNSVNAARFAAGPDQPLALDTVMRHPHLAEQPLLLLMLALYDAEGNALRDAGDLRTEELYERLLTRFAHREVTKLGDGRPRRDRDQRVEAELRKLSVVAFAMFNRDTQWITEAELEGDLRALPGLVAAPPPRTGPADLRAPLEPAELALGSFFFVHRARAARDGIALETYEFLHATFGEFLVARLIHGVVRSLIARERASTFPSGAAVDDDLLHALLSFAPLAVRRQTVDFLRGMAAEMSEDDRADWVDLLIRVLGSAMAARPPRAFDGYEPKSLPVPGRIAAYTSNLVLLILCASGTTAAELLRAGDTGGRAAVNAWRDLCFLWRSQSAASGWNSLPTTIALARTRRGDDLDAALRLTADPASADRTVDMSWSLWMPESVGDGRFHSFGNVLETARRETHLTCDMLGDVQQHVLDPFVLAGSDDAGGVFVDLPASGYTSLLSALLRMQTASRMPLSERMDLYRSITPWVADGTLFGSCLRQMAADPELRPDFVAEILTNVVEFGLFRKYRQDSVRCVLAHLVPSEDRRLANVLEKLIPLDRAEWTELDVDAAIRLAELDLLILTTWDEDLTVLLDRYAAKRPDFVVRIRILAAPA